MTAKAWKRTLATLVVLAATAAGCGGGGGSGGGGSGGGDTIHLGFSAWPGWFPWQVAEEKGLFKAAGLNVDLKYFESYLDSLNALAAGQLDANSQTLNDTISSVAGGAAEKVVLVNDNSTGNDQIVVTSDITSVADLRGKTIAAEQGTVDHYLLLLGMEQAGLGPADIKFQPLETGAAAAAFASGRLDGVGVFAPFTTQALKRDGAHALFTSSDYPGAIPDHLVVSQNLLTKRPDDIQKLVDVWWTTQEWIAAHHDEAVTIMAKRAGVSVADYESYDKGTTIFTLAQNKEAFTSGSTPAHLDHEAGLIADFLVKVGLVDKKPDLATLFDDRFVKAASAKS